MSDLAELDLADLLARDEGFEVGLATDADFRIAGEMILQLKKVEADVVESYREAKAEAYLAHKMICDSEKKDIGDTRRAGKVLSMARTKYHADRMEASKAETGLAPVLPPTRGISMIEEWVYRIVDASLVPRKWCAPDEKLIKKAVKDLKSLARIPGIEVYKDYRERVRVSK